MLPGRDCVLLAQLVHVLEVFAPAWLEYEPAWHFVHLLEPGASAYVPASQLLHAADPAQLLNLPGGHA